MDEHLIKLKQMVEVIKKLSDESVSKDDLQDVISHYNAVEEGIQAISSQIEIAHQDHFKNANVELDAVVEATEQATNKIMDAAEKVQNALGEAKVDNPAIQESLQEIFEACSFQDITGQRINKVLKTLMKVEVIVQSLNALMVGKISPEAFGESIKDATSTEPEDALLQGPQLDEEAPSQDDVDKLFADS